jgi:septum formation protein
MRIILGSASASRQQILKDMGFEFEVLTADIDEKAIRDSDPLQLTLKIAHAKADALMEKAGPDALLITSDQVGAIGDDILEKPVSNEEAKQLYLKYQAQPRLAINGVVVTNTTTGERQEFTETATVYFKPMTEANIDKVFQSMDPTKYAGGYSVEHPAMKPYIDRIEGNINTVMGLPSKTSVVINGMLSAQ